MKISQISQCRYTDISRINFTHSKKVSNAFKWYDFHALNLILHKYFHDIFSFFQTLKLSASLSPTLSNLILARVLDTYPGTLILFEILGKLFTECSKAILFALKEHHIISNEGIGGDS